jgi:hypothetical protein
MNLFVPNSNRQDAARRWSIIVCLSALAIGCSTNRIKSFDLDMGGLELEFYNPEMAPPAVGFFGVQTNRLNATPASWPKLMPLER